MKRTTVFLEEALQRDLKSLARKEARATASLVREALLSYVARKKRRSRLELSFLAVGRSGRHDTAERHEELLWKALAPHQEQRRRRRSARGGKRAS